MARTLRRRAWVVAAFLIAGCQDKADTKLPGLPDAAVTKDAGGDAAKDAGDDGAEAGSEVAEAAPDSMEAAEEVGDDGGEDVPAADAEADVAADAPADLPPDLPKDMPKDLPKDPPVELKGEGPPPPPPPPAGCFPAGAVLPSGPPGYAYTRSNMGWFGIPDDRRGPVAVLTDGSVAFGGQFAFSGDLDPTPAVDMRNYQDGSCFVTKMTAGGAYAWSQTFGLSATTMCQVYAVVGGPDGSVVAAGQFRGSVDFDPGVDTMDIHDGETMAAGSAFIVKYAADGTFLWARSVDPSAPSRVFGLARAPNGDIIAVGDFTGSLNFDMESMTPTFKDASGMTMDAFVMRVSAGDESVPWVKTFGGFGGDEAAYDVAVGGDGSIAVAGTFRSDTNFGGGEVQPAGLGADAFVAKYQGDSSYQWARTWGGTADDVARAVAIGPDSAVFVVGSFTDQVEFNRESNDRSDMHKSRGATDAFVTRFNAGGDYCWSHVWGGSLGDLATAVVVAPDGSIRVSGAFAGSVDLDPTSDHADVHSPRDTDADGYVLAFAADATFAWNWVVGGPGISGAVGMSMTSAGGLVLGGLFTSKTGADFDPGSGSDTHTSDPTTIAPSYWITWLNP